MKKCKMCNNDFEANLDNFYKNNKSNQFTIKEIEI